MYRGSGLLSGGCRGISYPLYTLIPPPPEGPWYQDNAHVTGLGMYFGKRLFHLFKSVPGLILETLASVGPTHTTDFLRNAVIWSFCNILVYYGAKKGRGPDLFRE